MMEENSCHPALSWTYLTKDLSVIGWPKLKNPGPDLYAVVCWTKGHIPLSCYVFANSAPDAIERVQKSVAEWMRTAEETGRDVSVNYDRAKKFLANENYTWEAEEAPKDAVLQGGQFWASNSGWSLYLDEEPPSNELS